MAIKLLLADVDGTLVTHDKALTPDAVSAAKALRDAGIRLALTSGRPPRGMRMLIEPLELTGMLAGFNGGVFVDPDMTVKECHLLEPAVAREALDAILGAGLDAWVYTQDEWLIRRMDAPHVAREALKAILDAGLDAWVYTQDEWLIRRVDAPHVAREAQTVQFEARVVPSFTEDHFNACAKIVGVSDDHDKVAAAEQATQAALGSRASSTRSQPYYLDVTHPQANKGAVVDALAKMFGIDREQIATIGDGGNDTLMFARSGLSIAMGNASDAVKAKASVVTDTNEKDGFAKAVRAHVLEQAA